MILLAEDWKKYPTAIVDTQTVNRSFVRLASVYRSMGVKNHAFLLALINPRLQGVDPFSKDLTADQMYDIAVECKINPWYFFREVARAPAIGSGDSSPLEANRGNMALFWCFFNHVMIILIQIRQTGKSFSTDVLMTLLMNVICQNTAINLMTKDDVLRRKNVERLKEIALELPLYLRQKGKDDVNNGEEITIRSLNNTYTTHVPQSSPKRAYNMGRGLTSAIFHIDEGPFQPNISIALPAALAATGAAVDKAKAAGTPYGTILTTTAGKKNDKDGEFIYNLLMDAAVWSERFLDAATPEELEKMVRRNSRGGKFIINATFNHTQLGKTDEWLRQKLEESLQTGDDANRDYFNMWTSGSQTSPLPLDIAERISKSSVKEPGIVISNPHAYITRWYIPVETIEHRMANGRFILGKDTSNAVGADDLSLVLTDVETLEVVAAGNYNETNLISYAQWICNILVEFKNVTAIIENRSTGQMLIDYLLVMLPRHGEDPFKRLFNTVVQNYDEHRERWEEVRQPMGRRNPELLTRYKKTFGFSTSGSGMASRTELYGSTLQLAAKRGADVIRDQPLIGQMLSLVTKNGRIDHPDGGHDDLVIGWLLCNWLLIHGKNLGHYGIDIRKVMSRMKLHREETDEDLRRREEQKALRQKIEAVYEELSQETDEYVCMKLEYDLRRLDTHVEVEQGEVYSVDDLIRKAIENRRSRRRGQAARLGSDTLDRSINPSFQHHGTFSDRPLTLSDYR